MDPLLLFALLVVLSTVAVVGVWARRRRRPAAGARSIASSLSKTKERLAGRLGAALSRVDAGALDELEEALISADVGADASRRLVQHVRSARPAGPGGMQEVLGRELLAMFSGRDRGLKMSGHPAVIVVVGVNGTGKTTTVAKLGLHLQERGTAPLLGGADTFRAAADTQLRHWGERLGLPVVTGAPRADPAAVAYDAVAAARARNRDVVIIDTAGRLHSDHNLMEELGKIVRVLSREGAVDEVLLVVDATVGQNGLAQAREFAEAVDVTGIVLTKLDGSARGGVVVAAEHVYDIPVKFVGTGERPRDLVPFDPAEFVKGLLEDS